MESIIMNNTLAHLPKTELAKSYYERNKDVSGQSFERITARKEKIISKCIIPLNDVMLELNEEIIENPGDKDLRKEILEIQGRLVSVRTMLIKHYQLEQTIK